MEARPFEASLSTSGGAGFDYDAAFGRNIGWITEWEQQEFRKKTVAIAGMGGVGGQHALTLTRLGIGGLHIADLDRFDVANLNRQAGAFISTINLEKTAVMAQMTRDINPELRLKIFDHGVNDQNIDEFLSGANLFVDGFDFFAIDIRRKVFKRCAELGIPAITAAPIGFGASYLIFMPGRMTFEDYFRLEGLSEQQQYVNFALGVAPKGLHRRYLVDPSRVDLTGRRGPSAAAAIQLCAGVVGIEAVKILLGRGKVHAAPAYHQFDPYRERFVRGYLRHGNAGPLQRLKCLIGYKAFSRLSRNARPREVPAVGSEIEHILDLARWAPSGDNSQPWRFKILGEDRVSVSVTRKEDDIYDYNNGQPTLLATGMMLETMRIAASRFGRTVEWKYLGPKGPGHGIEVRLTKQPSITEDPLYPYITIRSVDRRRYQTRRLSDEQKDALSRAIGDEFEVDWYESRSKRWRAARINAMATDIRLRLPEAFPVHKRILDWDRRFSPDGVPAAAVGVDPLTLKLMKFVLRNWPRADFFNRYLAGTAMPRLELDLWPGVLCAGHFVIQRRQPTTPGDQLPSLLRAGQAIQRFWLTAVAMGLSMQPAIAPLIFSWYAVSGGRFSDIKAIKKLARRLAKTEGFDPRRTLFRGRLGRPTRSTVGARSIRRPLRTLIE
jgi:sulfur-carrier protein adenylyltransferase/sulfurtransferase